MADLKDMVKMDRANRRQRARQLKAQLVAAYTAENRSLDAVRHFMPSTSSRSSASDGSSCCYNVVDWIEEDPSILWEPFAAGTTLMHWAAQHLRYEQINHQTKTPSVWRSSLKDANVAISDPWEWLLEHASNTNSRMFTEQRDGGGESCLDCFMSTWQNGSRRNDPYQFSTAVEAIRQQPHLMEQLQCMVQRMEQQQDTANGNHSFSTSSAKPWAAMGDRRVTLVCKVWTAWKRLCRAANKHSDHSSPSSLVAFLARTGRAFDSFAWLAVTLHSHECRQPTDQGELPLHLWASSPTPTTEETDALWRYLLRVYPEAVTHLDKDGRLPLHRALTRANKPLFQAQMLALACPETLGYPDPHHEFGLYPFATAAQAARLEVRSVMRATQRRHPSQRLYDWLDTCRRDMDTYEQEVSTALLGHVYVMLRALPQALEYSRQAATAAIAKEKEERASTNYYSTTASSSAGSTVKDAYAKVLHDLV